jgi:hypothetical protein
MTPDSEARDDVTIEVIYLLAALVTPILAVALLETVAWELFGLDAVVWRIVGRVVLGLAATVGLALAVLLNRRFRPISRQDSTTR